ncbi:arsinothricin resistance N-acetyltransferase ArsN1 family A [Brevibacillus massiliensis]|jgi:phosphinothricin acetyltransferase|uniref:arsinothricin resistance N-acetyltransferase ArsN1 family A n=1 Tax=Brevibacillus massiliensis TaxID=1118054 RepID=UPI0002EFB1C0|nr:arsinothricin resistance N-acetyltransferase ArsN1 family A [Brevibacillus massiliensis]
MSDVAVRSAEPADVAAILRIYNQGIEDRIATLESDPKDMAYMEGWFREHQGRYAVLVAGIAGEIVGWASLNRYSHRCAYNGVADLSIYVDRRFRGKGIGSQLLHAIDKVAKANGFYKIVLFTFPSNQLGQGLYRKCGYREVGVFEKQGILDGRFVDVMAMEKWLLS